MTVMVFADYGTAPLISFPKRDLRPEGSSCNTTGPTGFPAAGVMKNGVCQPIATGKEWTYSAAVVPPPAVMIPSRSGTCVAGYRYVPAQPAHPCAGGARCYVQATEARCERDTSVLGIAERILGGGLPLAIPGPKPPVPPPPPVVSPQIVPPPPPQVAPQPVPPVALPAPVPIPVQVQPGTAAAAAVETINAQAAQLTQQQVQAAQAGMGPALGVGVGGLLLMALLLR